MQQQGSNMRYSCRIERPGGVAALALALVGMMVLQSAVPAEASAASDLLARLRGFFSPVPTVPAVNLTAYEGRWYEIASSAAVKATFQIGCRCVTASYRLNATRGTLDVLNRCILPIGSPNLVYAVPGLAWIPNNSEPGKMKVKLESPFTAGMPPADYWITMLGPTVHAGNHTVYSAAVVSDPRRIFVWVLYRMNTMSDDVYEYIMDELSDRGFLPSTIFRSRQSSACDYDSLPPAMNPMFPNLRGADPLDLSGLLQDLFGSLIPSFGP